MEHQWARLARLTGRGISGLPEILFTTDTHAPCLK